jgi:hypothetical protein
MAQKVRPRHGKRESRDIWGDTALIAATNKGHKDEVELLLNKGAKIEAKNKSGNTAAAGTGQAEVVTLLLDKGAKIKARGHEGTTALIAAAWWGHERVAAPAGQRRPDRGQDPGRQNGPDPRCRHGPQGDGVYAAPKTPRSKPRLSMVTRP